MEWLIPTTSLLFISLFLLITQGLSEDKGDSSILCYVCNSYDDARCGHPFQKQHFPLLNCSDLNYLDDNSQRLLKLENKTEPFICRKNYQTVTLGGKTDTRIVRGCGYVSKKKANYGVEEEEEDDQVGEDRCFRKAGTFEVMVTYCSCTKTGCNGAPSKLANYVFSSSLSLFISLPFFF